MSKAKIYLYLEGRERVQLKTPEHSVECVEVPNESCPHCKQPLKVAGAKMHIGGHDFYTASAGCISCGAYLGELRAYVSTLFGLEEDRAVLQGRTRVY